MATTSYQKVTLVEEGQTNYQWFKKTLRTQRTSPFSFHFQMFKEGDPLVIIGSKGHSIYDEI